MSTISQSEFDKLVSHTVRIELEHGSTLLYRLSMQAKTALNNFLRTDAISDYENEFIWFYIPQDRLVIINKKDVIRITFCFDHLLDPEPRYIDNFKFLKKSKTPLEDEVIGEDEFGDENQSLPQLIVAHHRKMEKTELVKGVTMETEGYFDNISSYSSLSPGDVEGFDFNYIEEVDEWFMSTFTYLEFIDDDGETNFYAITQPLGN